MNHVFQFRRTLFAAGGAVALAALVAIAAGEGKADKNKPYPLKTCAVSGEKLGGEMGKPYVFSYQGREIKLCCKGCLKDFNKKPATYIKKLEEAEKAAKAGAKPAAPVPGHEHKH